MTIMSTTADAIAQCYFFLVSWKIIFAVDALVSSCAMRLAVKIKMRMDPFRVRSIYAKIIVASTSTFDKSTSRFLFSKTS